MEWSFPVIILVIAFVVLLTFVIIRVWIYPKPSAPVFKRYYGDTYAEFGSITIQYDAPGGGTKVYDVVNGSKYYIPQAATNVTVNFSIYSVDLSQVTYNSNLPSSGNFMPDNTINMYSPLSPVFQSGNIDPLSAPGTNTEYWVALKTYPDNIFITQTLFNIVVT
jgi:hypothetical protein